MTKYFNVEIIDSNQTNVTRERDPDDEWSRDDLQHYTTITGVRTANSGTNYMYDVVVPFEIIPEKDYYLVYVEYSTGDSFHHEKGLVRYIDLFETREKAEKLAKQIKEHYDLSSNNPEIRWNKKPYKPPKNYSEWQFTYLNEEDKEVVCQVSWTGYFESLSSVNVKKVGYVAGRDELIQYHY